MKLKKKQVWVKRLIPTNKNYTPLLLGRKYELNRFLKAIQLFARNDKLGG